MTSKKRIAKLTNQCSPFFAQLYEKLDEFNERIERMRP